MGNKSYTASNSAPPQRVGITIKSHEELAVMRRAGRVVGQVLTLLKRSVYPGMKTWDLEVIASEEIRRLGAAATFKGYRGFPASICTSINEEIVHGIPGDRVIVDGDLVKVDVGATVEGFVGDAAVTLGVGDVSSEAQALIDVTESSLKDGIASVREGGHIGDIGAAVSHLIESRGYSVVKEYVGHGVGRFLHEEPQVPNFGIHGRGPLLREGMVIAIEPMVNIGDWRTRVLEDNWTVVTSDGSLSAHFEHTVAITGGRAEILTQG